MTGKVRNGETGPPLLRPGTDSNEPSGDLGPADALILSPHLDDAALSCGGWIHRLADEGRRVVVVTLFTADPPAEGWLSDLARDLHQRWELGQDAVERRRGEDREALALLGATLRHLGFLDALYRRDDDDGEGEGDPLYPTLETLFGPIHRDDRVLVHRLARTFSRLPEADRIVAPLGIGGHVDHRLVREAAVHAFGPRLEFFEDFPYNRSKRALAKGLRDALGPMWRWRRRRQRLGRHHIDRKLEAIRCYRSQLGTAFPDDATLERQVRRASRFGECLWQRRGEPAT